jgi:MoxR-like ATPase
MSTETPFSTSSATAELMEQILYEVKRVVVGQDRFLERVMVGMLAGGHLLVEGVPGLAKTLTIKTLADTVRGQFKRIQFTPDLVPADLVGTRIYNQKTGEFSTSLGPVFANLLLADEINRAPAKVQSALLEVMQEYQVTIAGETHRVHEPFLVMATQNPIETEGTYPLPEAQVDRFMMKVLVGYPSEEEEFVIVQRVTGVGKDIVPVATTDQLAALQRECRKGYVDPSLVQYAVKIVAATREPARIDPSHRRRACARVPARPRVRAAAGCHRSHPRRAAPSPRAVLRSTGRRPHVRPDPGQDHAADRRTR